jgi:Flp pilus assembly protein TadD
MDAATKHHLIVGREFYLGGDHENAEPHLVAVVESHDGFADVHNMLGVIRWQSNRRELARGSFERALEINPQYTEAALNLAVCYNELGRYKDARAVYERAAGGSDPTAASIERLDSFVRGKIANLHNDVGAAYQAVGLLGHAAAEYRKALELCPTFVDIRTRLATALRDLGRIPEALDELTAIRDSAPDYLPGRTHLGLTLWRAGRFEEARAQWEFVLTRDPDNRSCRVYLSMTDGSAPA